MDVRELGARGRGVIATERLDGSKSLVRALPFALVPNDRCLLSRCAVCLTDIGVQLCAACESAVLCKRCGASDHASLIHADECAALRRLASAPLNERPRDTQSLRLLMRTLAASCSAERSPSSDQYVSEDGEWWGDGDVAADEVEDVWSLFGPRLAELGEELPCVGGLSLDEALIDMAKQAIRLNQIGGSLLCVEALLTLSPSAARSTRA